MKLASDATECPECHGDWRGEQIDPADLAKGYYGHQAPCLTKRTWDDDYDAAALCTCPPRYYSHLVGVEDGSYDGVSWWLCPFCGAKWNRWTGEPVSYAN